MSTNPSDPDFITIKTACAIIGGDKPISLPTFYRRFKDLIEHPSQGISRIRRGRLIETLDERLARRDASSIGGAK